MEPKFAIGQEVIVTGEGWRKGRTGYIDSVSQGETEEDVIPVYSVFFPELNRASFVCENEMIENTRLSVEAEEVIVIDSDKIKDVDVAAEIGNRMNRMVVHLPGGMDGIQKVNRKALRDALDRTESQETPKTEPSVPDSSTKEEKLNPKKDETVRPR